MGAGAGIQGLVRRMAPGRLLDIPAGDGTDSEELNRLGFRVCSLDLRARPSSRPELLWVRADANTCFPFRSGSFDYIVSREGIEHLENQAGFLRECARVLRPGGTLVVTTPNLMHLAARVSQFLTGQRNLRRGLINEVQSLRYARESHPYHGHVFLIDYFRLRYLARLAGFDRLSFTTDSYSPTAVALAWIAPVIYCAMKFSARTAFRRAGKKQRRPVPRQLTDEIIRDVLSPTLLFGKRMIVTARKSTE